MFRQIYKTLKRAWKNDISNWDVKIERLLTDFFKPTLTLSERVEFLRELEDRLVLRSFVYISEEEKYDAQRCLLKVFQTLVELLPDNLILKEGSAERKLWCKCTVALASRKEFELEELGFSPSTDDVAPHCSPMQKQVAHTYKHVLEHALEQAICMLSQEGEPLDSASGELQSLDRDTAEYCVELLAIAFFRLPVLQGQILKYLDPLVTRERYPFNLVPLPALDHDEKTDEEASSLCTPDPEAAQPVNPYLEPVPLVPNASAAVKSGASSPTIVAAKTEWSFLEKRRLEYDRQHKTRAMRWLDVFARIDALAAPHLVTEASPPQKGKSSRVTFPSKKVLRSAEKRFMASHPNLFNWFYFTDKMDTGLATTLGIAKESSSHEDASNAGQVRWLENVFRNGERFCYFFTNIIRIVEVSIERHRHYLNKHASKHDRAHHDKGSVNAQFRQLNKCCWYVLPCYTLFLKLLCNVLQELAFGMSVKEIPMWASAKAQAPRPPTRVAFVCGGVLPRKRVLECTAHVLRNQNPMLLNIFMEICFQHTNAFDRSSVARCLEWIDLWLRSCLVPSQTFPKYHIAKQPAVFPSGVNCALLCDSMEVLLLDEHVETLSVALSFLYRHLQSFSDVHWIRIVSKVLLSEQCFIKLFCCWNADIRNYFHFLMVYRLFRNNRMCMPLHTDNVLAETFRLKPVKISTDDAELAVCAALDKALGVLMDAVDFKSSILESVPAASPRERAKRSVKASANRERLYFCYDAYIEPALKNYRARLLEYYVEASKAPTEHVVSPPLPPPLR